MSSHRLLALLLAAASLAPPSLDAADESAAAPRFTFAWPLDTEHPKPRGGTSKGVPVVLDREPSDAWRALQAPGLDARERDRRAILAMAGTWRVAFDFVEVASFVPRAGPPRAPYQSWGTEKVYVDADRPGLVALVHVLEMRIVGKDGQPLAPIVTKHWRQEWTYEPDAIVEYAGRERWMRRTVDATERRGAWRQAVFQVDESPRYAGIGRWQHGPSMSTWISNDTWRPLPRREWTVRKDYQALVGTNRHTIVPSGWLQEENNLKAVLTDGRAIDASRPYVGREYGVARYERVKDFDFGDADRYYARTRAFWNQVKDTWDADFARDGAITLKGQPDQQNYFVPLFEQAEKVEGGASVDDAVTAARASIRDMRVAR